MNYLIPYFFLFLMYWIRCGGAVYFSVPVRRSTAIKCILFLTFYNPLFKDTLQIFILCSTFVSYKNIPVGYITRGYFSFHISQVAPRTVHHLTDSYWAGTPLTEILCYKLNSRFLHHTFMFTRQWLRILIDEEMSWFSVIFM